MSGSGNDGANFIRKLCEDHNAGLLRFLRRFSRDPQLVQDLAQDTWVAFMKRCADTTQAPLREPWDYLRTVAKNLASQHFRSRRGKGERVGSNQEGGGDDPAEDAADIPTSQDDEQFYSIELREALEYAKESLPDPLRGVLELSLHGWKIQDIADQSKKSPHQVERRLTEARRLVKSILLNSKQGWPRK